MRPYHAKIRRSRRIRYVGFTLLGLIFGLGIAWGASILLHKTTTYSDCILEHAPQAKTNPAFFAIRDACYRKYQSPSTE